MPKNNRKIVGLTVLIILFIISLFSLSSFDSELHLVFCDVGQGDAVLLKRKNQEILVDGGPDSSVLNCLSQSLPPWDRTIELVVLTHPDDDHLSGLIGVLERYQIGKVIANSMIKDTAAFQSFHDLVLAKHIPVYSPIAGDKVSLGQIQIKILWPEKKVGKEPVWQKPLNEVKAETGESLVLGATDPTNDNSIVLEASYGDFDVLLSGDIDSKSEEKIDFPDIEVLKIPHHGSKYSTSPSLLQESKPELAVISVGKNRFGHPTHEVLDLLKSLGINFLRTDESGKIEITSNGHWWKTN